MALHAICPDMTPPATLTSSRDAREDTPEQPAGRSTDAAPQADEDGSAAIRIHVGTSIADAERRLIQRTLEHHDGDKKATADVLGVSLRTLYNRLNDYANGEDADESP